MIVQSVSASRLRRAPGTRRLHRTASILALSTGIIGLAGLATPAAAQCVEGVPGEYTCSGDLQVGQIIVGDDTSAATTAGFSVDTTGNGNGLALSMTGDGKITYTDVQASSLTGAGVAFTSTGASGLDAGSVSVFSDGAIVANGAQGLRIENAGGGDTGAVWLGSIVNTGGIGVFMRDAAGSGDLNLVVADINASDDAIRLDFHGSGLLGLTALEPIIGAAGSGLRIEGDTANGDYNIELGDVTGGAWGVLIDNDGTGATRLVSTGSITGLGEAGITINGDIDTTDIDLAVNQVNGETYGLQITNAGTGSTNIVASGTVTAATLDGIVAVNDVNTGQLSITAVDVFGRSGVIAQNYGTGATEVVSTGLVAGFGTDGVRVHNDTATTDVLVDVNDVVGQNAGIDVTNFGAGDTTVLASGAVTSEGGRGIDIATGTNSQDITVEAVDVSGAFTGIHVEHEGLGAVSVTTTGVVSAAELAGIEVTNGSGTDIFVQTASVIGGETGISTDNDGSGSTFIDASGPVSGWLVGVSAINQAGGNALTIEVGDVTSSSGTGIDVVNFGSGFTRVESDGVVTGGVSDGIAVQIGTASQGLRVDVDEVHGQENGIVLDNQGAGITVVSATGDISAVTGSGVLVTNGLGTTEIQIDVAGVAGGDRGISASSQGVGGVYVNATAEVSGADFGILAETGATNTNIQINAADVASDGAAIVAANSGSGFTWVTSTGTVVGADAGVRAFAGANSFSLIVDANNVSGGVDGIDAISFGLGPVEITTRGVVQGGNEAIEAFSDLNGVTIVNEGTVRNSSGLSSDRAITASGGSVSITNENLLVGEVAVTANASLMLNTGTWNTAAGTSTFAGGDDSAFNMLGAVISTGGASGIAEETTWSGLELFVNSGRLQMLDGGAGDTLDTSADAVFEDTAELRVDVAGAGLSDTFRTTGAVEIEPGSTLTVNTAQPLVLNSQYIVVEADGGVTGQFDFDDQLITAFAGLRDGYTANTAFLEFVQLKALADAALTPNQEETADGADSLPDGDPLKDALLLLPTDAAAQDAFDQLSGEIHPASRTAMADDSRLPRTAVLDRLGYDEPEGSVWGRVFGSFGTSDGDSNVAELGRDSRGMIFGVDETFGGFTLGIAAGAFETEIDLGARNSEATVESVHILTYAGGRFGAWRVRGGAGYAVTSSDTKRRIVFPGFADAVDAQYDGSVLQGFVEAGYRVSIGGGHVEPFIGLTGLQVKTDAFVERGGDAALSGQERSEQTAISALGLRFETSPEGRYSLRGSTGWRHSWGDLDPSNVHAFEGGAPFTILGAAQSADAAFANVEARWKVSPAATFGIAYDGAVGANSQDHAITGSLRVIF